MQKHWDIFCHVVDNYGDAGVCWRLAYQLAHEFNLSVRLWIDDLSVLQKFCPDIALDRTQQISANITVYQWTQSLPLPIAAADVVIEAFACELPEAYLAAMRTQRSLCINLEYLSAEHWVGDCHGLPSPQFGSEQTMSSAPKTGPAQKNAVLKKFFFFPGFRSNTGGVLGERDLLHRRRTFQQSRRERDNFLQRIGIAMPSQALRISLFAYRDAPIEQLLQVLAIQSKPIFCCVPEGQPLAAVAQFFGENLAVGAIRKRGALTIVVLPFLSLDDYDRLLWSCDINFVRGEDSFLRAQWAGLPFVWQIYAQPERAHWPKLDAFLELYTEHLAPSDAAAIYACWHAWNGGGNIDAAWRAYTAALPTLREAAERWAERLAAGRNLAAALVQFCANQV